jgi:hypothetical protein
MIKAMFHDCKNSQVLFVISQQIEDLRVRLDNGLNPREVKMELAREYGLAGRGRSLWRRADRPAWRFLYIQRRYAR